MRNLQQVSISLRIQLISAVLSVLVLILAGISTLDIYNSLVNSQMYTSRVVVGEALSIIKYYYSLYQQGKMSEEEAKTTAIAVVSNMYYDKTNYIFMYSYDCTLLVNKSRPDLVGKKRCDIAMDPKGVKYVQLGIDIAKKGGGYYTYIFNAAGSTEAHKKISYAEGFDAWQLMVGSGAFPSDLNWILIQHVLAIFGLFFVGLIVGLKIVNNLSKSIVNTIHGWAKDVLEKIKMLDKEK